MWLLLASSTRLGSFLPPQTCKYNLQGRAGFSGCLAEFFYLFIYLFILVEDAVGLSVASAKGLAHLASDCPSGSHSYPPGLPLKENRGALGFQALLPPGFGVLPLWSCLHSEHGSPETLFPLLRLPAAPPLWRQCDHVTFICGWWLRSFLRGTILE